MLRKEAPNHSEGQAGNECPQLVRRVLIADSLPEEAFQPLVAARYEVDYKPTITHDELIISIGEYAALVVRSRTKVDKDVLAAAEKLEVVVRAGVGIDNIDVDFATQRGIIVATTPEGNTNSAAEQTIALMFAVARQIPQAHQEILQGKWTPVEHVGFEVKGKTIALVGFGHVGQAVAKKAIGLGMQVIAYDPFSSRENARNLGVELIDDMNQLLKEADVLTLHVALNAETNRMIGKEALGKMKKTAILINTARGSVVDEEALIEALRKGIIAGAGLDVQEKEPGGNPDFRPMRNVVLTPHLGASTKEAQIRVADEAAQQIMAIFGGKPASGSINIPRISPEALREQAPYIDVGFMLAQLGLAITPSKRIGRVEIEYGGGLSRIDTTPLQAAVMSGLLRGITDERVNAVNYGKIAQDIGIEVRESKDPIHADGRANLIRVKLIKRGGGMTEIAGVLGHDGPRITAIDDFPVDISGSSHLLLCWNQDAPGAIAQVSKVLAEDGINIKSMSVESNGKGQALMAIVPYEKIARATVDKIMGGSSIISSAQYIDLSNNSH